MKQENCLLINTILTISSYNRILPIKRVENRAETIRLKSKKLT